LLAFDPSNNGSYAWNERHQLASASVGGTGSTFQYDALGRRVQQNAGATIDNYVYDGMNAVQIQSSMTGNLDLLSGLWLDDWLASTDSTGSVALLRNALGSTIALVNSAGSLATQDSYEPFGKTTQSGASTSNPYAFAGRELDQSGLYFMRARYYNPLLSRFISSDPIGLAGGQANFFAYVYNSPMNFVDPLGLSGGPGENPAPVGNVNFGCEQGPGTCVQGPPQQLAVRVKKFVFTPAPTPTKTPTPTPTQTPTATPTISPEIIKMLQGFGIIPSPTPTATPPGIPPPAGPMPTPLPRGQSPNGEIG
jgi:RHS repeat-associated protein